MEHEMITVNDILTQLYPELPDDDNNYRLFKMNEGFSMNQLTETDFAYYKRINDFTDDDKLVIVENSQIVYIEE